MNGVKEINFLGSIVGLHTEEVRKRAAERELFNQIERMKIIVTNDAIGAICRHYALDVFSCVPIDQITNENFKAIRWPQIQRAVDFTLGRRAAWGKNRT